MKVLFIIDRIELKYFEFNDLVTNFWMIKELLSSGVNVDVSTIDMLGLENNSVFAHSYNSFLKDGNIFYDKSSLKKSLVEDYQMVVFRPDPPVDLDYINATYLFDFVNKSNTLIVNDTSAIRSFNEKLHTVLFSSLMPNHILTSSFDDIIRFLNDNEEIILKPLNQCFGSGVMYLKKGDKNTAVIINTMTQNGKRLLMIQKYIPQAQYGDKRVLFLGDKVLPYSIQKIPSNNDFKFCEHNDSNIKKAVLSDSEISKFTPVAQKLNSMGICMAGLDVIDEKIIEINVTSPCYFIKEINNYFGVHIEKDINEFLLSKVSNFVGR